MYPIRYLPGFDLYPSVSIRCHSWNKPRNLSHTVTKIDSRNKQRISQRSLLDDAVFPESVEELYCTLGEIGINTRREATT